MTGGPDTGSGPTRRVWRWLLICSTAAFAISAFLLWKETRGAVLPGCDGVTSCNVVLASRWSRWAGLPVALLGTGCYVGLTLGLLGWANLKAASPARRILWRAMTMQSITGIGFVAWLTWLQAFVVKHFCLYCMSAHLTGAIAFVLILASARRVTGSPPFVWRNTLPGALAVALLIGVHVGAAAEPGHIQVSDAESLALDAPAASASPGIRIGKPKTDRTVTLLDGNLTFDLSQVPVVGDPHAELAALDLFDYQCPSCRDLHGKLHAYLEARGTGLALVVLPVPMEADCNPGLKHTLPMFKGSCDYARLAMAVRAADPGAFADYHAWLMEGRKPPEPEEARARAADLLGGEAALDSALADPRVGQWIADGLAIHEYVGGRTIPKLVTATTVVRYTGGSERKLHRTLDEAFSQDFPDR